MALSSPGTEITIIDESQYLPAAPNSIPLVVLATAQNKINASGTGVATGTTKGNAGKLYQITSQRDLITYFGNPFFYKTTSGTPIQGYELNEYGLLAAYSTLGSTNLIYAIRADIDMAALVGKTVRPSSSPDNGSWWLNTASSQWGIFEFSSTSGSFTNKVPYVITDSFNVTSSGAPIDGYPAAIGSYAVVLVNTSGVNPTNNPNTYGTYYYKAGANLPATHSLYGQWVKVGSPDWQNAWPTIKGTATAPVISTTGNLILTRNKTTATVSGVINDGTSASVAGNTLTVTEIISSTSQLAVGTVIRGTGIAEGTYITALGTGTGGTGTYTVNNSQLVNTKVATITSGSISSTTLTVTSVGSGTALSVGTLIIGSSNVPASALATSTAYTIGTVNTTDWGLAGAAYSASVTGYIGDVAGPNMASSGVIMTVTAFTSGYLTPGMYISDSTEAVTAGSYIDSQIWDWAALVTASGSSGSTTITVTSATGLATGQLITASGIPTGTTITNISGTTITLSAQLTSALTSAAATVYSETADAVSKSYSSGGASGATTITLNNATGLVAGMVVSGPGIVGGTTVNSVDLTTGIVTLSAGLNQQAAGVYKFYAATTGRRGIYKIAGVGNQTAGTPYSGSGAQTELTIKGQPTPGTAFTTGATITWGAGGAGTGSANKSVLAGTYITALGTGTGTTGTYTVSSSQTVPAGVITGYKNSMTGQGSTIITATAGNSVTTVQAAINSGDIPYVSAEVVDDKLYIYDATPTTTSYDSALYLSGTASVLTDLGLTAGQYAAPHLTYGTNAAQPLWRSTDTNPHPTGSVWIKTNAFNKGMNLVMSQYSSGTGLYSTKTVTVSESDWAVNTTLDATGGKAIPVNSVYAKVSSTETGIEQPLQFFYRAASGASTFVGTISNPTGFEIGSTVDVQVSQPGSKTLLPTAAGAGIVSITGSSGVIVAYKYRVTLAGTTATDFVKAWNSTNIPYTKASIDATTGAIVLTHTEGGCIILDDSRNHSTNPTTVSPLTVTGLSVYDMTAGTGTLGAKYGTFVENYDWTQSGVSPLSTTGGSGTGLKVNLNSNGYNFTISINTGGASYAVDDLVDIVGITGADGETIQARVISVSAGAVTSLVPTTGRITPQFNVLLSNWEVFDYTSNDLSPVNSPVNGTPWFHSVINQVDIMSNVGGKWYGYLNVAYDSNGLAYSGTNLGNNATGIIVSANMPSTQTDGTALVYGDLWLDSGDLENYPVIRRWQSVNSIDQWVLIDNTDQQSDKGILFADARWGTSGSIDPVNDAIPTIASLLTSNYLDMDAPEGTSYPQGMILFNTRRSGYNVKTFRTGYFNSTDFSGTVPTFTSAWVTASGLKTDGSPYMGRKAQRAMIVAAMKVAVDTSVELREDQTSFNLLCAPGYPELQPNMISLNNDRHQTAYIIGDTPLRLANDANAITKWATNAAGATTSGEDGLVTRDSYMGIYYPSGITTDLTGSQVVVPASHMILRTIIHNDTVAYPWFAPAGMRRGTIDNATNIGYIDAASGEFQTTKNRVALRDVQYTNFINPIAYFNNVGLLNYGNKNSYDSQSALDRTNVARLVCYIRDRLQIAVRPFIFEPNDAATRSQVRGVITTLFADIQAKRGIYDYLVVCDSSNNTPARIDRNELWIDIAIEPVKAIEFVYIPVRIMNTGEIATLGK
jgi:hypothetical protein